MKKKGKVNKGLSPSEFMRDLRPECYSDTDDRVAYHLESAVFEHYLESITPHNLTHEFEVFCRKLCERVICPNLRPQSGPDGGGDSKADTETFTVASDISTLYIGKPNSDTERWAFLISAQKTWTKKVKSDVEGLIQTGRTYNHITFITSRFTRSKDRSRIEQELKDKFGVPVEILDRSWIVNEVIDKDRRDIAFNYLHVGEAKSDPLRLGPDDYSRTRQLADIEKSIEDPDMYIGMEQQRVTEALVAAKLSRNLERPRTETDGRFLRAVRLADADGVYKQQLEARYDHIWTAFWWFDDIEFLCNSYDSFKDFAIRSDQAKNLGLLCNIHALLFNSIIHKHLSRENSQFDARTHELKQILKKVADDIDNPNNSLEARTSIAIIQMHELFLDDKKGEFEEIWLEFSLILEAAKGLGEYRAENLIQMIDVAGLIASNDPAYKKLVEQVADFVIERTGEVEGALVLLKQAQKLDFSENLEIIKLLGKAALLLSKEECSDDLIEALKLLTLSYKSAGLLWAARASCLSLITALTIEGEENNEISPVIMPVMKLWAWISLELGHLPDFLMARQLLGHFALTIPLSDESKTNIEEWLIELDAGISSWFLNMDVQTLHKLVTLPDILEALGMFTSRSGLLRAFGYSIDFIKSDEGFPETEPNKDIEKFFSLLASQPVATALNRSLILNEGKEIFRTKILGMTIEVCFESSHISIILAEVVLGCLEAFFSTTLEKSIAPHTESLIITIIESDTVSFPSLDIDKYEMKAQLKWPISLMPNSYKHQQTIGSFITEICHKTLCATCFVNDMDRLFSGLYENEAVHYRITMAMLITNSRNRLTKSDFSTLNDWQDFASKQYEVFDNRQEIQKIELPNQDSETREEGRTSLSHINNHRDLNINSVIDLHCWNEARWQGVAFAQYPSGPPILAFAFHDEKGARKIFTRWKERFGSIDANEEIYLSVVKKLTDENPNYYYFLVTSNPSNREFLGQDEVTSSPIRFTMMTPKDGVNLERFLRDYQQHQKFLLMPAVLRGTEFPKLISELAIEKKNLEVKYAKNIKSQDVESAVFGRYS
ncbi:MAG: hypothetical protein ACRBBR_06580 [Cellvibrionaceae bacterium]